MEGTNADVADAPDAPEAVAVEGAKGGSSIEEVVRPEEATSHFGQHLAPHGRSRFMEGIELGSGEDEHRHVGFGHDGCRSIAAFEQGELSEEGACRQVGQPHPVPVDRRPCLRR